jgi:hypothetical protein
VQCIPKGNPLASLVGEVLLRKCCYFMDRFCCGLLCRVVAIRNGTIESFVRFLWRRKSSSSSSTIWTADASDIETLQFALDGVTYEIDLTPDNSSRLRGSLASFVASARRTGGRAKRGGSVIGVKQSAAGHTKEQARAIRDWAKANGQRLSDRGRVPQLPSMRSRRRTAESRGRCR